MVMVPASSSQTPTLRTEPSARTLRMSRSMERSPFAVRLTVPVTPLKEEDMILWTKFESRGDSKSLMADETATA